MHGNIVTFDPLAGEYDRYRVGYSETLVDTVMDFGIPPRGNVLDIGCGTGLATGQFAARGLNMTGVDPSDGMLVRARQRVPSARFVTGRAEALPFPDASFDAAIAAQVFHWLDAPRAIAEAMRVVRPTGIVAVWWKILAADDPMRELREQVQRELGLAPTRDPLPAGFGAFYSAPFADHTLRVIPFGPHFTVAGWVGYERSRRLLRDAYGDEQRDAYLARLQALLTERYGSPEARFQVRYVQFLYVGAVPPKP